MPQFWETSFSLGRQTVCSVSHCFTWKHPHIICILVVHLSFNLGLAQHKQERLKFTCIHRATFKSILFTRAAWFWKKVTLQYLSFVILWFEKIQEFSSDTCRLVGLFGCMINWSSAPFHQTYLIAVYTGPTATSNKLQEPLNWTKLLIIRWTFLVD